MGYKSQIMLYGYYLCYAGIFRVTSPPLAQLTAQEAALAGSWSIPIPYTHIDEEEEGWRLAIEINPCRITQKLVLN